jgi:polar amino acid transport system substrate-binding protein
MKYWQWGFLWFLWLGAASAEPLKIVTGEDYAPYTRSNLPQGGLAAALVKQAFAKVDREVALTWLPWARGIAQAKQGLFAATFPYLKNDEREKDFLYSDEILSVRSTAFLKPGNKKFDFSKPETLSGSVYCLPQGWAPTPKLAALLAAGLIKRETPATVSACAKMVLLGRADYFVTGDVQATQALLDAELPPDALEKADGPPLTSTPLYLIASKEIPGSVELLAAFNKGLAISKKDGTYDKLVRTYLP